MANPNSSVARKKSSRRAGKVDTAKTVQGDSKAQVKEKAVVKSADDSASGSKSSKSAAPVRESVGLQGYADKCVRFLKSVRSEVERVTWPSFKDLRTATIVVVVTLLLVSGYMGLVDWMFTKLFGTPVATGF